MVTNEDIVASIGCWETVDECLTLTLANVFF